MWHKLKHSISKIYAFNYLFLSYTIYKSYITMQKYKWLSNLYFSRKPFLQINSYKELKFLKIKWIKAGLLGLTSKELPRLPSLLAFLFTFPSPQDTPAKLWNSKTQLKNYSIVIHSVSFTCYCYHLVGWLV